MRLGTSLTIIVLCCLLLLAGCEKLAVRRAIGLYDKGRYTDSLAMLDKLAGSDNPKVRATALLYRGFCYFKLSDYEQAAVEFKRIADELRESKLHDDALFWLGRCYQVQGQTDRALEYYQKVVNYPKKGKAYSNMKAMAANYMRFINSHSDSRGIAPR